MYQFTEKKTAKKVLVAANVSRLGAGGVGEAFLIFCSKSKTNSLIFKQQKAPAVAKALLGAERNPRRSYRELYDKLVCDLIRESGRELYRRTA